MTPRAAGIVGLVLACAGIAGCSSRQHYPAAWPTRLAADAHCRQFAGTYRVSPADSTDSTSLTQLLFATPAAQAGEWVVLRFDDGGRLHVAVSAGEPEAPSISLGELSYSCRQGVLIAKGPGEWFGFGYQLGYGIGHRTNKLELHLIPGAIVVEQKTRSFGVLMVLPLTARYSRWHRFERATTPPPAGSAAAGGPEGPRLPAT